MAASLENIPLGECPPHCQSQDTLSPRTIATPPTPRTTRTESTVFSLSRSESLWTTQPSSSSTCDIYCFPIHLMITGGSILAVGLLISGLFFSGHNRQVTIILGPALLSIGLMVLVVGLVLIPITKENRKQSTMKRPVSFYRQPMFKL